jgi:hypothetical protein
VHWTRERPGHLQRWNARYARYTFSTSDSTGPSRLAIVLGRPVSSDVLRRGATGDLNGKPVRVRRNSRRRFFRRLRHLEIDAGDERYELGNRWIGTAFHTATGRVLWTTRSPIIPGEMRSDLTAMEVTVVAAVSETGLANSTSLLHPLMIGIWE